MAIRMSGLISGLDTDSIVQELMSAQSMKKQKVVNKQTKLTWTQEIWKSLNTKLYSFYTGSLSKLKTQGNYQTKKATSSNDSVVTATATNTAATGAHSLKIKTLASAQYVTGGKTGVTGTKTTTKLSALGMDAGTTITVKSGSEEETLTVDENTTIDDFLTTCKNAGLNATFDTSQQRFFISSEKSGAEDAFSITTGTSNRAGADTAINNLISNATGTDNGIYDNYITAADVIQAKLESTIAVSGDSLTNAAIDILNCVRGYYDDTTKQAKLDTYGITAGEYTAYESAFNAALAVDDTDSTLNNTMSDYLGGAATAAEVLTNFDTVAASNDTILFKSELKTAYDNLKSMTANAYNNLKGLDITGATTYTEAELTGLGITQEQYDNYVLLANHVDKTELDSQMAVYIANEIGGATLRADGTSQLTALGLNEIDSTGKTSADNITAANSSVMSVKWASDAEIELDGAVLTDSTNEFTVNGLTMNLTSTTLNKQTGEYEEVQLNVTNDTEAVYDMVKGFVTEYNDILKELNEKYSAKSAKGYDPLTDEEKEAMSDDEVEKWETKIKDSLLRRDDTINSITMAMRQAMQSTVKVDGKTYALSSLGIKTSSDYTEGGVLHIYGNSDDDTYASEENSLKSMLEEDPDVVMEVLTNATKNLYSSFTDKMARSSLSSALTFYNDKQMTSQQTSYSKEISNWTTKLKDMEDRYYEQFTAMEKAMSKLQSQSSYLSSMLGTSS